MNVSCPECRSVFRVDPEKVPRVGVRARCSVCGGVIIVGGAGSIDEEFGLPVAVSAVEVTRVEVEPALIGATPAAAGVIGAAATEAPARQPTPARPQTPIPRALTPPAGLFAAAPRTAPAKGTAPTPPAPTPPIQTPPPPPPRPRAASKPAPAAPSSGAPQRPVIFSPRVAPGGTGTAASGGAASPSPRPAMPPRPFAGTGATGASAPTPARNASVTPGRAPINPFLANDPNAKARRLARALISDLVTYFPDRREEGLRDGTLRDLFAEEIKKSYEEYVEQVGREFADNTAHFKDALNEILAGGQSMF
jgi:predicted Zn finger-like uncharacterized protein